MEQTTKLNLYQKIQKIRVELQEMNLKKNGQNEFAHFKYYELADFLPPLNKLADKYGVCNCISFDNDFATLVIYDADSDQNIKFTSPMRELKLNGNAIQGLGGVETYSRRYLYLTAYEIVENDLFDAVAGQIKTDEIKTKPLKPNLQESKTNVSQANPELVKKLDSLLTEIERAAILERYQIKSIAQLSNKILERLIERKQESA